MTGVVQLLFLHNIIRPYTHRVRQDHEKVSYTECQSMSTKYKSVRVECIKRFQGGMFCYFRTDGTIFLAEISVHTSKVVNWQINK